MPEIRLGSQENFPNINLGSVELQEIWLGAVLVWQNNQGPVFMDVQWDGTNFTIPGFPMDVNDWTFNADTLAGQVDGTAPIGANESRNITLIVNTIEDLDNEDPMDPDRDWIVGYRLQRPDGSWAAGDPDSLLFNGDGSPIADYGTTLPGTSSTYDSANDEFTSGAETDATSSITVAIRAIDDTGTADTPSTTIVDSAGQDFADSGEWKLYILDSRGGESPEGVINVDLTYQAPNGRIRNNVAVGGANPVGVNALISTSSTSPTAYTNVTIGGDANATLNYGNILGGPLTLTTADQLAWDVGGVTSTNPTVTVAIPQSDAGTATPARIDLTVLGRSYDGVTATRTTIASAFLRSGPSCRPGYTGTGGGTNWNGSFSFTTDTGGNTAVCNPLVSAPTPTPSLGGTCTSSGSLAGFTVSDPGCPTGTATPNTCNVSVSGTTGGIALTANGSINFSGVFPASPSTCDLTVTCTGEAGGFGPECGTTINGIAIDCAGSDCDGGTPQTPCNAPTATIGNAMPSDYSGGGFVGGSFCSAPGGTSSVSVNYTNIIGTCSVVCPATVNAGDPINCTVNQSLNGVSVTTSTLSVGAISCGASGTSVSGATINALVSGSVNYGNGTACQGGPGGTTNYSGPGAVSCITPPPPAPTFDVGTCTFSCTTGTLTGGTATIAAGTMGTRTCVDSGVSSAATTGNCPATPPIPAVTATGTAACSGVTAAWNITVTGLSADRCFYVDYPFHAPTGSYQSGTNATVTAGETANVIIVDPMGAACAGFYTGATWPGFTVLATQAITAPAGTCMDPGNLGTPMTFTINTPAVP